MRPWHRDVLAYLRANPSCAVARSSGLDRFYHIVGATGPAICGATPSKGLEWDRRPIVKTGPALDYEVLCPRCEMRVTAKGTSERLF